MTLGSEELLNLRTDIKNLSSQLKRITLDQDSLKKYAVEHFEENENKKREKQKMKFQTKLTEFADKIKERDIDIFLGEVFDKFDDLNSQLFDDEPNEVYDVDFEYFLIHRSPDQLKRWIEKVDVFKNQFKQDLMNTFVR